MSDERLFQGFPYVEPLLSDHPALAPYVTLETGEKAQYLQHSGVAGTVPDTHFTNILLSNLLYHVRNIEEKIGGDGVVSEKETEEQPITAFNAVSVVREMNEEAEKAIVKASVCLEDTRNFLRARGKVPG